VSKSPAFQFYVRDWLCSRKVFSMSGDSVKAYVYLLCEAWLQEPRATLPMDEKELAEMARIDVQKWRTISAEVMPCFTEQKIGDFSRFVNEKLYEVSSQYYKNQRINNKNALKTRIKREKTPTGGSSSSSSSASSSKNKEKRESPHAFQENSPEYYISRRLWDRIKDTGSFQVEPDFQDWARQIDLMHRVDHRDYNFILCVLRECFHDEFWKDNLRSPGGLRKHINNGKLDKLVSKALECDKMTDEQVVEYVKQKTKAPAVSNG
jgi:uncharacterized protein YdaU (DUF1376 family)